LSEIHGWDRQRNAFFWARVWAASSMVILLMLPPVDPISTKIAEIIFKTVWEGGGKVLGWMGGGLNDSRKQLIFQASRRYVETYMERHGTLKVLGMSQPVKLESIYTSVQFLGAEGIRQYKSESTLEEVYRQASQRRFQGECKKEDGLTVANQQQFLMVLGQPGAGKSTFLRRMGLAALRRKQDGYKPECVPVFIELKRFTTSEIDLEATIATELETCGFPKPKESAKRLLEQGKLLVLLDGLDEVPTSQIDAAIQKIQDFVDRYDKNRFIASCRTAAYQSRFRRFVDVVMADFDEAQMQQFIINWFQSEQDRQAGTAQKCWELLQQPEYAATKELAQTPLLLTFLCLVFDDSQTFPKNRAVLYGDALAVLLKRWSAEKRIQRDPIYQDLTLPLEEMMLAEIAHAGFVAERLFFSKPEVIQQIKLCLESNLNAPKHLDGEQVLTAIQIQQGILVERARGVLSFSHLTLQEYLVAQHIVNHDLIETLVAEHLTDRRWREVILLVAGSLRGSADALLLRMETETQKFINTDKLKALVNWAETMTDGSVGNYNPAFKRVVALLPALALDFDFDFDLIRNFALVHAHSLALDLALAFFLNFDLTLDLDCNSTLLSALKLHRALSRARQLDLNRALVHARQLHRTLDLDLDRTFNLDLDLDRARKFASLKIFRADNFTELLAQLKALKIQVPNDRQPYEVRSAFAKQIQAVWFNALRLDPAWVKLPEVEVELLNNYLYTNELLVCCKEAAVRVSPQTWAGIEARMLTVQEGE
jgi:energy-coupling factor transporter ATP-binding protein EcfA2